MLSPQTWGQHCTVPFHAPSSAFKHTERSLGCGPAVPEAAEGDLLKNRQCGSGESPLGSTEVLVAFGELCMLSTVLLIPLHLSSRPGISVPQICPLLLITTASLEQQHLSDMSYRGLFLDPWAPVCFSVLLQPTFPRPTLSRPPHHCPGA